MEPIFTEIPFGTPASDDYRIIESLFAGIPDTTPPSRDVGSSVNNLDIVHSSNIVRAYSDIYNPDVIDMNTTKVDAIDVNEVTDSTTDVTVLPQDTTSYLHLLHLISARTTRLATLRTAALSSSICSFDPPSPSSGICFDDIYDFSRWKKFTEGRPKTHVFFQGKMFTYDKLPPFLHSIQNRSGKTRANGKKKNDLTSVVCNAVTTTFNNSVDVVTNSVLNPLAPDFNNVHLSNVSDCPTFLKDLRIQNVGNIIIAHLNINSLRYKFDSLVQIINSNIDILVIGETKLDSTFPKKSSFIINGFKAPYRKDRNGDGGGIIIYVREDIPSQEKDHNFPSNVEALAVEINLRKTKFLLMGIYHSTNKDYGTTDDVFIQAIGASLDNFSFYDKFIICGDFNMKEGDVCLDNFLDEYHAKSIVKVPTCFKNPSNPSCVDLFITNSCRSFMKTTAISTGLSDFHKMIVTVMRTTFKKAEPITIHYRDFSHYDKKAFGNDVQQKLEGQPREYDALEKSFLEVLDVHAPQKSRLVRANQKPYVSKKMRKAIMVRSQLQNKYFKYGTVEHHTAFKRQKNYCNRLYKGVTNNCGNTGPEKLIFRSKKSCPPRIKERSKKLAAPYVPRMKNLPAP